MLITISSLWGIVLGAALNILQFPIKALKNGVGLWFLVIIHAILLLGQFALHLWFYRMPDGIPKRILHNIDTLYFTFIIFTCTFYIITLAVRLVICAITRAPILTAIEGKWWILIPVVLVSICISLFGTLRIQNAVRTDFPVKSELTHQGKSIRIALVADLHLGGGAGEHLLTDMVDIINDAGADLVLIAGDLTDSTTSYEDMQNFCGKLQEISPQLGVVFTPGNHEKDAHYDIEPMLLESGVQILHNTALTLENGVIVAGQLYKDEEDIDAVLEVSGIERGEQPVIVMRHLPSGIAEELDGRCDLVVSGHTHGYRYPMIDIFHKYYYDPLYGFRRFDKGTAAVTTSGLSCWGYQFKLQSPNEVAIIDFEY